MGASCGLQQVHIPKRPSAIVSLHGLLLKLLMFCWACRCCTNHPSLSAALGTSIPSMSAARPFSASFNGELPVFCRTKDTDLSCAAPAVGPTCCQLVSYTACCADTGSKLLHSSVCTPQHCPNANDAAPYTVMSCFMQSYSATQWCQGLL